MVVEASGLRRIPYANVRKTTTTTTATTTTSNLAGEGNFMFGLQASHMSKTLADRQNAIRVSYVHD